jgi:hypothetical protein
MAQNLTSQPTVSSESRRLQLMLRAWEAVSTERELPGVLAALADVLAPAVPFDSIGIIDFTIPNEVAAEDGERHRLLALHVAGVPRFEGETPEQLAQRSDRYRPPLAEVRPLIPIRQNTATTIVPASPTPVTICCKKKAGIGTSSIWLKMASALTLPCRW